MKKLVDLMDRFCNIKLSVRFFGDFDSAAPLFKTLFINPESSVFIVKE